MTDHTAAPACCAKTPASPSQLAKLWRTYRPLWAVLGMSASITGALLWAVPDLMFMLVWMGVTLCLFACFKLANADAFRAGFVLYDPLAKRWPFYAVLYPLLEAMVGLMLLAHVAPLAAYAIGFLTLGLTGIGIALAIRQRRPLTCACLGGANGLPLGLTSLVENGVMSLMCLWGAMATLM